MFGRKQFGTFLVGLSLLGVLAGAAAEAQTILPLGGAAFESPEGIAVDATGNVYVADTFHSAVKQIQAYGGYRTVTALGSGFDAPPGVAVDSAGNVYVADAGNNAVEQILAAGGYTTVNTLGGTFNFNGPFGVAVDSAGNVFVADTGNSAVEEILAAGGYTVVKTIGSGFSYPTGVAVDAADNVYVADNANNAVKQVLAAGGYTTVNTLGSGFNTPYGVAVDAAGNVFVADTGNNAIKEIASGGAVTTVAGGFEFPYGVAVDGSGNVFLSDTGKSVVKEILAPTPLVASVLPGARSVALGSPATIFATLINGGSTALSGCGVSLSAEAPAGLSLSYQTTNPATNALTGTLNTPVSLAGGGAYQTFLLSFDGTAPFTAPALPIVFDCTGSPAAGDIPGVDTIDLVMSSTPIADIIALAATPSSNGVVAMPRGGAGAFAVASINIGATDAITVSVDTGNAVLPVKATICQTDPASGQCLQPPTPTVTLSYAGNTAPTFSVFVQSSGAIAFAPAASRVFVRFQDASGGLHGSTSVAVETQ